MVGPCHRRRHEASSSSRLWCARYVWVEPLFLEACRRPVRFEMGGIDHQPVRLSALGREFSEDAVEHAQAAPADEAIIDRLVRTVGGRRITPAQAVPDHEDDAAQDPPVIDPRDAVRQWEIRLNPAHLRLAQQPQLGHHQHLLGAAIESNDCRKRK